MSLTAKNGTTTVSGGSIDQLLPGEEAEGYIIFRDLRNGMEPESLKISSAGQSCETPSIEVVAITFEITSRQNHLVIQNKPPVRKESVSETPAAQTVIPATPKRCESADLLTHATAPTAVDLPDAVYTDEARRAKVEGKAQFCATVGVDGLLHDIEALNHLGSGLDEQALDSLHQWRFRPAMLDGKPVPRVIRVEVHFRLQSL